MPDLLNDALPPVTLADMIHEVRRELGQRAHVYPRLVEKGRLKGSTADEQVRRLQAVLAILLAWQLGPAA